MHQGDGFGADALQQVGGAQVDVESPSQAFPAHTPVDGSTDHVDLSDGGKQVDLMVIGGNFRHLWRTDRVDAQAQLLQGQHAQIAVHQRLIGLFAVGLET